MNAVNAVNAVNVANEVILIIGDHKEVRSALRERLAMAFPDYEVIESPAAEESVAATLRRSPCVVVIDMGAETARPLDIIRRLKAVRSTIRIVVWTMHAWESYRADAAAAGADAYVLKDDTQDRLLTVVEQLLTATAEAHPHEAEEKGGRTITIS